MTKQQIQERIDLHRKFDTPRYAEIAVPKGLVRIMVPGFEFYEQTNDRFGNVSWCRSNMSWEQKAGILLNVIDLAKFEEV